MNELKEILSYASVITWPAAAVGVTYIASKAGLLSALASRIRMVTDNKKISDLEDFRFLQETNHNHDLANLMSSDAEQWKVINQLQRDVAFIRGRLTGRDN